MSRTIRGEKGAGYEYWGRRAFGPGKEASKPGKFTKKLTHKKERRNKLLKRREPEENS